MNLIVSAAIVLLNPYVTIYISWLKKPAVSFRPAWMLSGTGTQKIRETAVLMNPVSRT